uniref:Uncharacterized protein n=1 Tax=Steinernema glaseri TaxID=37863 RepID=A0A1I7ZKD9_9BILA
MTFSSYIVNGTYFGVTCLSNSVPSSILVISQLFGNESPRYPLVTFDRNIRNIRWIVTIGAVQRLHLPFFRLLCFLVFLFSSLISPFLFRPLIRTE